MFPDSQSHTLSSQPNPRSYPFLVCFSLCYFVAFTQRTTVQTTSAQLSRFSFATVLQPPHVIIALLVHRHNSMLPRHTDVQTLPYSPRSFASSFAYYHHTRWHSFLHDDPTLSHFLPRIFGPFARFLSYPMSSRSIPSWIIPCLSSSFSTIIYRIVSLFAFVTASFVSPHTLQLVLAVLVYNTL